MADNTFVVEGFDELSKQLGQKRDELIAAVIADLAGGALLIQGQAKANVRDEADDTGHLMQSIQVRSRDGGLVQEVYTPLKYAAPVEFGSAPHFPPPDALAGWARRHGMAGQEWAIARGIARHGTKAHPFLFPAFEHKRGDVQATLQATLARIIG